MLYDSDGAKPLLILNNGAARGILDAMKHIALSTALALVIGIAAQAAQAGCYADYKAKRDNPLRLHYGVMELRGGCTKRDARSEIAARLSGSGWTLLNVVSVFGDDGLAKRKTSAGQFYLRF